MRQHKNNRIERDRAVLEHRLRPMRDLQSLSTARPALNVSKAFPTIRRADFGTCELGVLNQLRLDRSLSKNGREDARLTGRAGDNSPARHQRNEASLRKPAEAAKTCGARRSAETKCAPFAIST